MEEIPFKTPHGSLFKVDREQIMKMAPESLFAGMTDPEQQMYVLNGETECIELNHESKYYNEIFAYMNGKNCVLLEYQDCWDSEVSEEILKDCEYFLLRVPRTGWRCRHLLKKSASIIQNSCGILKESMGLSSVSEILDFNRDSLEYRCVPVKSFL